MLEAKKYIYDFSEGDAGMKILLGGKGANLAQMWKIGLPVPPGFIITTEACHEYWKEQDFILSIWDDIKAAVARVEALAGKMFGREKDPLLVSVRSGAPVSMPGMMDTILNLGLNDKTVKALAEASGDERFAYDSFRRFIQMFSDVVLGVELASFEAKLKEKKVKYGVKDDNQLSAEALKELVGEYKMIVKEAWKDFPVDPWQQLRLAIDAVFRSWNTPRAVTYRKINNIPESYGTAVSVVTMASGTWGRLWYRSLLHQEPFDRRKQTFGEYRSTHRVRTSLRDKDAC